MKLLNKMARLFSSEKGMVPSYTVTYGELTTVCDYA